MAQTVSLTVQRQLFLTPYVKWFLERCGKTDSARELAEDIACALDGRYTKSGCIRFSAPTFLLFIIDAAFEGGPERIVVWHGPSDGGAFFNATILSRAQPSGVDFV